MKHCLEEIEVEIQGQMVRIVRNPARGKASSLASVKLLDAAIGTMDRWRLMKMKIFWNKFSYFSSVVLVTDQWSAVGNGPCGSGPEGQIEGSGSPTKPPSSPSPTTDPTGTD